ncbi:hypothetical protein LXA43DRAFT_1161692 [Ganoderma leucocontextum]|nr:hypothetical protein LXA43DRAFT_1161692 [Ganoderma leucocontextum]
MQPYYYDNRSSHPPNTLPSSYPADGWMDGLAAQQYGIDPRTYSHSGAPTQYPGNPYGATMSTAYPTSMPQGSYTDPNTLYPSAYSHQQQRSQWQPTTPSSTHDPYSVQHTSLNANPGSAPVFLYPPSHAGPPTAYPGPLTTYPPHSTAYPYPDDADDPSGRDASGRTRDWSQQFTMQGTPRERIAVACDRCRVRKMKCDGAQPACSNCQRAAHQGVECRYEPQPGRRGPDQGQRVRSSPGQRKPRRPAAQREGEDTPPESSGYRW